MELIKDDQKGRVYQDGKIKVFYRKEGSVSGDNSINVEELIYLINGSVELTVDDKVENLDAPARIKIPEKTYHKIVALSDITFILLE